MILRYTRPEMGKLWDIETKYQKWLDVEIAACEAWAELGEIPKDALKAIKKKARFDIQRIDEIEKVVKHDVIAFLTSVAQNLGIESRFIHKGLTSSDILDTALALLLQDSADIIIKDIRELMDVLKSQAYKYENTPMMGRSHGVHAEPITFGLKFALWYEDMKRNLERIKKAKDVISVGKLSGAVGTFSNIPPAIEEKVCKKLGLRPEPVATQIVQRDRHAEYLTTLALIAASIEKIAVEIRHLQMSEVLEAEEPFMAGQKGSSAMPHKRNPVGCENLTGLARLVRANAMAALENIALWHERDISHSSIERVIIPDSSILVDYMLNRIKGILEGLYVYPKRMKENMARSYGLYTSQRVMLALIEKGLDRESAYSIVQKNAMKSWKAGIQFKKLLLKDKEVKRYLTAKDIMNIFDLKYYLKNVDYIFKRVFRLSK
ncbi:MAG: adenylosuccinate lyase [Nitrospirae bacterium CG_4_10_14_0_8_um_filter_41_23]|nr:MAG: adenylosuccinate lyase [Nitrospirae bacterium CG11_big_fil_rev_8_21_14_0_20_41_14]PIV44280.1 MAG: adenylosuccinate lyase [Nitrospirae bacterium CG02_land_8_20_14_3_00_41_53]PIW86505.1 MAG: adenylosuccinate lyase [Nitrospirae bacterium CG_4_8_14_3_um_filter_41_47]PIY86954.1 MAG: adenylosuccinate lyase [Nitrospirae bacterium CG_4_10_14_0_8_um_filter_41_23]PJA79982.1 MAG: adenylosuccinate lyase [Nitrospirae bacterium CG_4_9_14_3_um_filter_41_27]